MKGRNKVADRFSNNSQENMSIRVSMQYILLIVQIFGYMPVIGIFHPQISSLTFSWVSRRMVYSLLTLTAAVFLTSIQIKKTISVKIQMYDVHKLFMSLVGVCSSILFIMLAREWPQFMKFWSTMEKAMDSYGWPDKLNRKINFITVLFIVVVLIEYSLVQLLDIEWVDYCGQYLKNDTKIDIFLSNKFISYSLFSHSEFSTIILLYSNFQVHFSFIFVDIFIIALGISLGARVKQIKKSIKTVALFEYTDEHIWREIREDYDRLEHLCKRVNCTFSWLITFSFVGNLLMILIQLFNSLQNKTKLGKIYLYYSFGFLVIRTACVCIFGASVNDESRKTLVHLYNLPDSIYNDEIERMIQQISTSNMALTGLNFFIIKRDLILKIAGALVTYELILIQFFGETLKADERSSTLCTQVIK